MYVCRVDHVCMYVCEYMCRVVRILWGGSFACGFVV